MYDEDKPFHMDKYGFLLAGMISIFTFWIWAACFFALFGLIPSMAFGINDTYLTVVGVISIILGFIWGFIPIGVGVVMIIDKYFN